MPSSLNGLNAYYFEGCPLSFEISSDNPYFKVENGGVYRKDNNNLIYVNNSCTSFTVPSNVSYIDKYAFINATNLEKVVFLGYESQYSSYLTIGNDNSFTTFKNCPLKEVFLYGEIERHMSNNNTNYNIFQNNTSIEKVTLGSKVTSIYDYMFDGCSNLSTVIVEGDISSVGTNSFRGTKWLTAGAVNGIAYLGNFAAAYDGVSKDISFKSTTTGIATGLFRSVKQLGKVVLPNSISTVPSLMFYSCEADEVVIPENISEISYNAFGYAKIAKLTINKSDAVLNVRSSHDDPFGAFRYASLGTVTISRTLKNSSYINEPDRQYAHPFGQAAIGKAIITEDIDISDLFNGCQLGSVALPDGLSSIGPKAFMYDHYNYTYRYNYNYSYESYFDNTLLQEVNIPASVSTIGSYAFYSCSSLTSVIVGNSIPVRIDDYTFSNRANATLYVPYGCKATYEAADYWKDFKEIIEMPDLTSNTISIDASAGCRGAQTSLPTVMDNKEQIVGFQFDLQLPEGITLARNTSGTYAASLTERAADHSLSVNKVGDGIYRFIAVSLNNSVFTGTEGPLLSAKLKIDESVAVGNYEVKVTNTEMTAIDKTVINSIDGLATLTVIDAEPGDVNGDMKVSVTDVSAIIGYILKDAPAIFIDSVADMNGDSKISVTDAVLVIDKILEQDRGAGSRTSKEPQ